MSAEWPLRGRDAEVARLVAALAPAGAGRPGAGAVLIGPPGAGRTRLVAEAVAVTGPAHAGVYRAAASPSAAAIPLGAFAALLPGGTDGTAPAACIAAAVGRIAAYGGPPLVVVDDAHHLDEASAVLVHQLVAARLATLALTVRWGEPRPALVDRLRLDHHLVGVDLAPLPLGGFHDLLAAALGGPVDPLTVDLLHERCAGNLHLTRELVDGCLAGGELYQVGDVWRWSGPGDAAPAGGTRRSTRRRLTRRLARPAGSAAEVPPPDALALGLAAGGRYRAALAALPPRAADEPAGRATARIVALAECGELAAAALVGRGWNPPPRGAREGELHLPVTAGTVALRLADPATAADLGRRLRSWSRASRSALVRGHAELIEGEAAILRGAFGTALERLRDANALLTDAGSPPAAGRARAQLGLAAALYGRRALAREALDGYAALDPARWPAHARLLGERWRAAALVALDQRHTAAATLRRQQGEAVAGEAWWAAMECAYLLLRATGDRTCATDLATYARRCDGPAAAAHLALAEGSASGQAAALSGAAAGYAALGLWPAAADAADRAFVLASRHERHRQAARFRAEVDGYLARCELAAPPAWLASTGRPHADLTPREREVAHHAARLPNRDVAARLEVSVRTVENHLRQVYAKLGITGRGGLAAALERRRLL